MPTEKGPILLEIVQPWIFSAKGVIFEIDIPQNPFRREIRSPLLPRFRGPIPLFVLFEPVAVRADLLFNGIRSLELGHLGR